MIVEALNVKTAMFFLAFIPQFISIHHSIQLSSTCVLPQFIVLETTCIILNTAVDLLAVVAANRFVASGTAGAARERLLSRISGGTMLALGMRVAIAKREN